ncbi:MAG: AEC family transporter [Candidatus Thorarchaeota archaeon]|nr:MAG: AEC family transporter [Candidatus Thorarchaeota archaeon]
MQTPNELLMSIGLFYVVIVLGYVTSRAYQGADSLNKYITSLIFNIMVPLLIFQTVLSASTQSIAETPSVIVIALFVHLSGFALMWVWLKRSTLDDKTTGTLLLCVTFNNALFLPLPLILMFIGESGVPIVAFFSITQMILLATLGSFLGSAYGSSDDGIIPIARKTIVSPPFLSVILALVIFPLGLTIPGVIAPILSFNGLATTYLALFVVGLGLGSRFAISDLRLALQVFSIRQVAVPIVTLLLLQLVAISGTTLDVLLLEAMMPPAVLTVIFAGGFRLDVEAAATIVTVGTLLILPLVPFIPLILILI